MDDFTQAKIARSSISRSWMHDPSHFKFARTSGLPRGTFRESRSERRGVWMAALVGAACALLLLIMENVTRISPP